MQLTNTIVSSLLLISSALAAPAAEINERTATPNRFGLMASRSASPIHLQQLAASGNSIYIGKATSSYCPLEPKKDCPAGTSTSFAGGANTMSMNVEVPGGQQVYIGPKGALKYTIAHSGYIPEGSTTTGFKYTPGADFGTLAHKGGFFACPTGVEGEYQVFVGVAGFDKKNCLGFEAIAPKVDGVGAWQYE